MTVKTAPNIFLLHGDDPAGLKERLNFICSSLSEPGMADLNLTRLDGKICGENDIRGAAMAIPFLADHRIVIVENPFAKITDGAHRKRFTKLLDEIPSTTWLVLVIPDQLSWRKGPDNNWEKYWKTLSQSHWLMKWAENNPGIVSEVGFGLPDQREMPKWIIEEAKKQGGEITPRAASSLAAMTGNETQIARLEIDKLLMYVDFKRPVDEADVDAVSISQNQSTVFELVEAIVKSEKSRALFILNKLLETDDPLSIFGVLISQFRKMVLIKDALQNNIAPGAIPREIGVEKFLVDKIIPSCRRFSLDELKMAYLRLSELDFEMKNGITPGDLAIEFFLLELKPAKT